MIDSNGFRCNVGIILSNDQGKLFLAKRVGQNAWQFPQGGIDKNESPEQAVFRELREETGLLPEHVELIGSTDGWLRYRLPKHLVRRHSKPLCIGQKQRWFMLRFTADDSCFDFSCSDKPEFEGGRWVDYWEPVKEVIFFKRKVYQRALKELKPLLEAELETAIDAADQRLGS